MEKTIGHCLKIAKEKKFCWNLLFVAKYLQYAEIYLECQVNRKPFMFLPSPWDLASDFEKYLIKFKEKYLKTEFYRGEKKDSMFRIQCLVS